MKKKNIYLRKSPPREEYLAIDPVEALIRVSSVAGFWDDLRRASGTPICMIEFPPSSQ